MTMHTRQIHDPIIRERAEFATWLCLALEKAHPKDAAQILVAYLDDIAAGMPTFDPWGDLRADAAFWADSAHVAELEQYACAALRRLGARALGIESRRRLFKALWKSLPDADRTAFLRAVNGRAR
jgi:hypothetical protein